MYFFSIVVAVAGEWQKANAHLGLREPAQFAKTFKAELLLLKLIHLFTREVLLIKKLEIKKLSPLLLYQF